MKKYTGRILLVNMIVAAFMLALEYLIVHVILDGPYWAVYIAYIITIQARRST